ncbi:MAG: cation transporter [Nevskia sp.]|nr:cation transporter [Nevskia sp.]
MGQHHHHHHRAHAHDPAVARDAVSERRLRWALGFLGAFTLVEAAGGFWANSVALMAEAAHMLADSASLVLAVLAIRVGRRPASPSRTYGHRRYQPLAAFVNGLALLVLTAAVVAEALRRLFATPPVDGALMLVVAALGGVANLAAFFALSGGSSLNERGARAHVLGDLLGSAAATAAALLILIFGWKIADPLLSLAVSTLILRSGWRLTRDSAHVLLEGAPPDFDIARVQRELTGVPGVAGVHHVHAWSLTGEQAMVTLHADLLPGADRQAALSAILRRLRERLAVTHATVQLEEGACAEPETPQCHEHR